MCGVFLTTRPREFPEGILEEAVSRLSHRGPDAHETLSLAPVGLAHTRLQVIGLGPVGAQPLVSSDGSRVLVFNGEIVNYRELAQGLGEQHTSDTRLLLRLLEEGNLELLGQMRGMFAFVYWDTVTGVVTAGRDRYGIKPLFVLLHKSGGLTFASEPAVLMSHPEGRQIDPLGVVHFLAEGHVGQSTTLLAHVQKIPPGSIRRWAIDASGKSSELPHAALSRGSWPQLSLTPALADSVHAHLVADVEVGVFLSGGVDSTTLAAMAAKDQEGIHAFTLSFPESPHLDEAAFASKNASALGLRHHVVTADYESMTAVMAELMVRTAEPLGDASVLPLALLAKAAREYVPVVLAGEGADEMLGGYRRYAIERYVRASPSLMPGAAIDIFARNRSASNVLRSVEAIMWGTRRQFRAHSALLLGEYAALVRAAPDLTASAMRDREAYWSALSGGSLSRPVRYDRQLWLPNTYLEKSDRATMMWGLECRVPFLDPIVEESTISGSLDLHGKDQLRRYLSEKHPDLTVPRIKRGLTLDLRRLLDTGLRSHYEYAVNERDGVIMRTLGRGAVGPLRTRSSRAPALAYRIAQLGLWDSLWQPVA